MKTIAAFFLCAVTAAAGTNDSERVFQSYDLFTSDAEPVVEILRDVTGEGGRVLHDRVGGRLFVMATPQQHARIAEILREINVPPVNVRLDVVFTDAGQQSDAGFELKPSGTVVVTPHDVSSDISVAAGAKYRDSTTQSDTAQTLLVQSGREGTLWVGEDVPFVDWLVQFGHHHGYLEPNVRVEQVGARLKVLPRVMGKGPLISVRLTPELSALVDGTARHIRYTNVATDITVQDGQAFTLGGLTDEKEFFEKFLIGIGRRGEKRRLDIQVTARIVNPGAP